MGILFAILYPLGRERYTEIALELEERRSRRQQGGSMSSIEILPVETSATERRRFATFPWQIYRNDPLWVPPLLGERIKFIDPQKGYFFNVGWQSSSSP